MKYWLYEKKRITGPLEPDVLSRRPGFGPSSLVCPAELSGQEPTDWLPANTIPELVGVPKGPPAAPEPPRLDTMMFASDLEGARRAVAALEMRVRLLEDARGKVDARADAESSVVSARLERLSEAIAAQDVRAEATDAALTACRASMDELHANLAATEEQIRQVAREAGAQEQGAKQAEAIRQHLEASLRDGLAGLHRLIRASETRLEALAGTTERLGASQAAFKSRIEDAVRRSVDESVPLRDLGTRQAALEARLGAVEQRPDPSPRVDELSGSLARLRETLDSRLAGLEGRPDPLPRMEDFGAALLRVQGALDQLRPEVADARTAAGSAADAARQAAEARARASGIAEKLEELKSALSGLQQRLPEVERRAEGMQAAATRAQEAISALLALQGRLIEVERRASQAEAMAPRLEELAAALRDMQARLGRPALEEPIGFESLAPDPFAARPAPGDPRVGALEKALADLGERLSRAEARPAPAAAAGPVAPPWLGYAVAGTSTLAAAVGIGLWAVQPNAPPLEPLPKPPAPVAVAAPSPAPPALPPEPRPMIPPAGAALPAEAAPPPKPKRRRKPAAPAAASIPGLAAEPAAAWAAAPGVISLVKAQLNPNGVVLKLSEPAKPKVTFFVSPPRLLLEFSDAKSKLPPRDLGSSRPHLTQVRARESDADGRLLWVEIQLDKAAVNKITTDGATLRVRFDFGGQ